jgi:hypothetical protein
MARPLDTYFSVLALFILFRETIEASIICGVLLQFLHRAKPGLKRAGACEARAGRALRSHLRLGSIMQRTTCHCCPESGSFSVLYSCETGLLAAGPHHVHRCLASRSVVRRRQRRGREHHLWDHLHRNLLHCPEQPV